MLDGLCRDAYDTCYSTAAPAMDLAHQRSSIVRAAEYLLALCAATAYSNILQATGAKILLRNKTSIFKQPSSFGKTVTKVPCKHVQSSKMDDNPDNYVTSDNKHTTSSYSHSPKFIYQAEVVVPHQSQKTCPLSARVTTLLSRVHLPNTHITSEAYEYSLSQPPFLILCSSLSQFSLPSPFSHQMNCCSVSTAIC